jgi:hypothetical protein
MTNDDLFWFFAVCVVGHHLILTLLIGLRRGRFSSRTFWTYFGSTLITALGLVVAAAAIRLEQRDFALGLLIALAVLYGAREVYLGRSGRQEVTAKRVTVSSLWRQT